MKKPWCVFNICSVLLCFFGGYSLMSPASLRISNPDGIVCLILLVGVPLFVLGSVAYAIYIRNCNALLRPSWDRFSLNWWGDPLQSLFLTTWNSMALTIGAIIRLPIDKSADCRAIAFWMAATFCCITIGLLIGQICAYRIYQNRIMSA